MSDISAIASAAVAINQSQVETQISLSMLRMNAQADQAIANMVAQSARQVAMLAGDVGTIIDVFA